jgi:membrane protease YdiL (CAAX protease family)
MTELAAPAVPRPPWGYWATLGWAVLAVVLTMAIGGVALVVGRPDMLADELDPLKDGQLLSATTLLWIIVDIAVFAWAARLARWPVGEYLGLVWASRREVVIALLVLAIFLPTVDVLSYLLGQDVVSPFQVDTYRSAKESGDLALYWLSLTVLAPVNEEIVFRGFLFRGWVRSARGALPGVLVITALFAIGHVQYDWFGMAQTFLVGALFGWVRWRSGSTLLTIIMHVIANVVATLETVVRVEWLS